MEAFLYQITVFQLSPNQVFGSKTGRTLIRYGLRRKLHILLIYHGYLF